LGITCPASSGRLLNAAAGGIRQGRARHEQLARNVFLSHSQTVERGEEAVLAIRLERSFSKEEPSSPAPQPDLLRRAYVEAASERSSASCRGLTLPEAALLAAAGHPAAHSR
jgi:membrane peptidoglycan carboxypeptidase